MKLTYRKEYASLEKGSISLRVQRFRVANDNHRFVTQHIANQRKTYMATGFCGKQYKEKPTFRQTGFPSTNRHGVSNQHESSIPIPRKKACCAKVTSRCVLSGPCFPNAALRRGSSASSALNATHRSISSYSHLCQRLRGGEGAVMLESHAATKLPTSIYFLGFLLAKQQLCRPEWSAGRRR